MSKGSVAGGSNLYMGTAAISERDLLQLAFQLVGEERFSGLKAGR
jgi:hypothetical protein